MALSSDGRRWFLINASPDLRAQLEAFPPLQPGADQTRGSPIQAVLLTNADLDHTLGLLLMREGQQIIVHAPAAVQASVAISIEPSLKAFCGAAWVEPPHDPAPLTGRDGQPSGLQYQVIDLAGKPPRFARGSDVQHSGHVAGYRFIDEQTGGRLLCLPGVAELEPSLREQLSQCDALLIDGTFWSEREMEQRGAGKALASEMGHVPVNGAGGSLKVLAELRVRHKVYTHINNTNPILIENSPERRQVEAAGCQVGWDGLEILI